jgi:hypothetical protein
MNPFVFQAHLARAGGAAVPLLLCLPPDLPAGAAGEQLEDLATEALTTPSFDPRAFVQALEARASLQVP